MPEKKRVSYEYEISKLAAAMHREMVDKLNGMVSKGHINISHFVILEFLNEKKTSNMSDLSNALKLTMSAATAIVDKMVGLRLVYRSRSSADRRVVDVTLTAKGKKTALKFAKYRLSMIKDIFAVLTEEDKKAYYKLLKKIYDGLRHR
jgi:DNA-binding MarR family transcriptional regulator